MPAVSVLMGIYNENRTMTAAAIDSILNQTFQDFEFIICDDGSAEEFYQWLQEYCKKDCRIKLLRSKKNQGLAAALNRCLRDASGTFAARMDADDVSIPERLEKQVRFLNRHTEYALVGSNARLTDRHGVWGERRLERQPEKDSFLSTSPFIHPAVMMRMDVVKSLRGYSEAVQVERSEDYDLFMRIYAAGFHGYNLQEALLEYREDVQSYAKRNYRYRLHECQVRYMGFRRLGILQGNLRYVCKPLLVGLIPGALLRIQRKKKFTVRNSGAESCVQSHDRDCHIKL